MILTIPLYPGTQLVNVRGFWIAGGVELPPFSTGITQPDLDRPIFRFDVVPPPDAEEIIAFDATAPNTNWNPGQYRLAILAPVPAPPPIIVPGGGAPPGLRTVTFRSVYESVLRQHGFDPVGDAVTHDTARAIAEQINTAIMYAWRYWEWPQLEFLQERAFRTVWTSGLQFRRVGVEGVADELYYASDTNYYRVLSTAPADPPPGTVPTNTTYFAPFNITDCYISLDQVNQTSIGEVIEIFRSDPRLTTAHDAHRVLFQPTEREISVIDYAGPTVFVQFRIVPSQFTMVPYAIGRTYKLNDSIYLAATGECYRAIQDNPTGDPIAQPTQWIKIPFPAIFAPYVVMAAYAGGLTEMRADKAPMDMARYSAAQGQAQLALDQEVDRLRAQGQHYRYKRWRTPYDSSYWWNYPCVSPNAV